jgi:hypothetical protein
MRLCAWVATTAKGSKSRVVGVTLEADFFHKALSQRSEYLAQHQIFTTTILTRTHTWIYSSIEQHRCCDRLLSFDVVSLDYFDDT